MRRESDDTGADETPRAQADWVPEEAVANLAMERQVHGGDETDEQISRRLLREAAPQITMGVIHTALHGSTDRVRLDAQRYVLDRVLGKVGDDVYESSKSPLETFAELLQKEAEAITASAAAATSEE